MTNQLSTSTLDRHSPAAASLPSAPRVLTIAGTDPTGGAGVQADLKSIAANGGYGMSVMTALVAQNTLGVQSIHVPPIDFLNDQLTSVSDDVVVDAVKIGMLFDTPLIVAVADWLRATRPPIVVLDPVMVASSGDRLLNERAEKAIRGLLPLADLVTPNIPELAVLVGEEPATTWEETLRQARLLSKQHGVMVLAKGGHLPGTEVRDALVNASEGTVVEFTVARVNTKNTHGTGCSLSSAVATLRAHNLSWEESARQAKGWLTESIEAADQLQVGRGNGPVSHFAGLWRHSPVTQPRADTIAAEWWGGITATRVKIDELEFVRTLADGTLSEDAFVWYLAQDALYLKDYSRALAEASKLAPTAAEQAFWASSAHDAIAAEIDLHAQWLPLDSMFDAQPSEATNGYVNHLLATAARGSYSALIAAVLPCFWIYVDVGSRLVENSLQNNPYSLWLQTYSDPGFQEVNRQAIHIVTAHASTASIETRQRMRTAFDVSAQHELAFFAAPLLQ